MQQYQKYSMRHPAPSHKNSTDLERKFWQDPAKIFKYSLYGADVDSSLFNRSNKNWNLNNLSTILDDIGYTIDGVTTPYLFVGAWGTAFAIHTEDMDLFSVSYLHHGAPKTWYIVPPKYGRLVETLCKKEYSDLYSAGCKGYMRHKIFFIDPDILRRHKVPFNTVTQEQGQFIVTWPRAYHQGFNHDFNIAEAINFATRKWIWYGRTAIPCTCRYVKNSFIDKKKCSFLYFEAVQSLRNALIKYRFFLQKKPDKY